ncbi:MAG: ThuA domain-containing protein [Verrucomicrobiota bacterium]
MKIILKPLLLLTLLLPPALTLEAAEPKRVIVCTVTTGFRHGSIPFAEKTLQKLGEESKAYTVVDWVRQPNEQPRKPNKPGDLKPDADEKAKAKYEEEMKKFDGAMIKYMAEVEKRSKETPLSPAEQMKAAMEKLSPANLVANKIDAVIFANTTGDLPLPDREGFIKWVEDGHGFCGMHSAGDTFHGFPGYLGMIQAEFKGHGRQVPADLVTGDKEHPANGGIGETWNLTQEEMYEFKDGSHDRAKLRALWFLRHHPQDVNKVGYAPVSWCLMSGKGRVFYTSLGHREDLWDETDAVKDRKNSVELSKQYQAHILGGIKWALGLESGSATPNPEVK